MICIPPGVQFEPFLLDHLVDAKGRYGLELNPTFLVLHQRLQLSCAGRICTGARSFAATAVRRSRSAFYSNSPTVSVRRSATLCCCCRSTNLWQNPSRFYSRSRPIMLGSCSVPRESTNRGRSSHVFTLRRVLPFLTDNPGPVLWRGGDRRRYSWISVHDQRSPHLYAGIGISECQLES